MKRGLLQVGWCAVALAVAGCGAVRVEPQTVLPKALVEPLPATVAVHYPAEFRDYTHKEKRYGTDYEIRLGPAHVAELNRLFSTMFARVVEVADPAKVPTLEPPVRLVLEPRFEDYSFLTPRDMVGDTFTVTIRYRLNVYEPGGERVDGYVFTGYGREPSGALTGTEPLLRATQRAMREAGAKLAVELPEEETVRLLLSGKPVAPRRAAGPEAHEAPDKTDRPPPAAAAPPVPPQEAPVAARPQPVQEAPPPDCDGFGSAAGAGCAAVTASYQNSVNR